MRFFLLLSFMLACLPSYATILAEHDPCDANADHLPDAAHYEVLECIERRERQILETLLEQADALWAARKYYQARLNVVHAMQFAQSLGDREKLNELSARLRLPDGDPRFLSREWVLRIKRK